MKAALISLGSKSSEMILEAMRIHFDEVDDINIKDIEINLGHTKDNILHKGKPLKKYDCVYSKGSYKYTPILRSIAEFLKADTYVPLQPETYTVGNDKFLTQLLLQKYNIPMPGTYLAATPKAAKEILEKINYPIIMKFPQGTQGKGVMVADSFASASAMIDALTALKQPFLIQEYVDTGGTDIRAIVVGDKVVASMKRVAEVGEVRSNIHAGGKGEAHAIDNYAKKIAIDAARAVGADVCGVDILEGVKGPTVIEVNTSPGLQGITAATKIDIASKIAKFLFERTKTLKESKTKTGKTQIFENLGISEAEQTKEEVVTNLDFRGERILLPVYITKKTMFKEDDEIVISSKQGKLTLSKMDIGK